MEGSEQAESTGSNERSTQERLLDAAEDLFCEHGFEGTSVREIATAADCNIASVNYYFGGKDNLYLEVWRRHLSLMRDTRLASIDRAMSQSSEPQLEELLRSYADSFLEPLVDKNRGSRFVKLMAREMIDQHLPRAMFLTEMVIPVMTALQQALTRICPGLDEPRARLAILSVVGQLIHGVCAQTMFEEANDSRVEGLDLTKAVEHIVRFSAAGIRACAGGKSE